MRDLLALPEGTSGDATLAAYERVLDEYECVLAAASIEKEMQSFLAKNPIVLVHDAKVVLPKYDLNGQHIPDFVVKHGDDYLLVELEGPSDRMYVQSSGQPADSAALRRAIVQTEDWQRWIRDNPSAARERLPGISSPQAWVIIGRKSTLDASSAIRLRESNETSRGKRRVFTFDDLLEDGKAYLANLRNL